MFLTLQIDQQTDGRFLAAIFDLPGGLAYGATHDEAFARVQAQALRVLVDRLETGEPTPSFLPLDFRTA